MNGENEEKTPDYIEVPVKSFTRDFLLAKYKRGTSESIPPQDIQLELLKSAMSGVRIALKNRAARPSGKVMLKLKLPDGMHPDEFHTTDLYAMGRILNEHVDAIRDEALEMASGLAGVPGTAAYMWLIKTGVDPAHESMLRQTSARLSKVSRFYIRRKEYLAKASHEKSLSQKKG